MTDRRGLTRRTLLAQAALGAAGLASGGRAQASPAASGAVFSLGLGPLPAGRPVRLRSPREFALVGVAWAGLAQPRIELRVRAAGGAWSRWALASVLGHGPAGTGSPLWAGRAEVVELRSSEPLRGVRLQFVAASALPPTSSAGTISPGAGVADSLPLAQPVLPAGAGQPPVIARQAWGHARARPSFRAAYGAVRLAFVHHTDGLNGYSAAQVPAMIYAIFLFHRDGHGWNDIGYNFVIDRFGRIWEARAGGIDLPVVGAHAGGYNLESTGVALLGTFSAALPSAAALDALERLLAWKLSLHGVPVDGRVEVEVNPGDAFYTPFRPGQRISLPRIAGHRQGCSTDCPGEALFLRLPRIRSQVRRLAGRPATLTLTLPGPGSTPAKFLTLAEGRLQAGVPQLAGGRLLGSAGEPIVGTTIELQTIVGGTGQTIATAATVADGVYAAALTLSRNALLRAVHRDSPAVVSPLVALAVAPSISLTTTGTAPLVIAGTVTPPAGPVTVTLYALVGSARQRVARHRVHPTADGAFTVDFGARAPGSYQVTATTRASASNAAGVSAPLAVTV